MNTVEVSYRADYHAKINFCRRQILITCRVARVGLAESRVSFDDAVLSRNPEHADLSALALATQSCNYAVISSTCPPSVRPQWPARSS
jgi:hypothetical protein